MNSIDKAAVFWTIGIVAVGIGFSLYGLNDDVISSENTKSTSLENEPSMIQNMVSSKLSSEMSIVSLDNNDSFDLVASNIIKNIDGQSYEMLGYNQQFPGPLLLANQGDQITVNFKNDLDFPTTVHWHGLRLDYTSDGVPGITQDPVLPGDTFEYELKFPDSGVFIYHPHVRNEMQMDLGLYGNILVESKDVKSTILQIPLILDDILISDGMIGEYDLELTTHTLMGRFGNTMMINGNADYSLQIEQDSVVRFYLTNTANTRVFNFGIDQHQLKLVADDASNYEKEKFVESIMMASSERRTIDVLFDKVGEYSITHTTPEKTYVLGKISIIPSNIKNNDDFNNLETNTNVINEINPFRKYFSIEPDLELEFDIKTSLMHQMDSENTDTMHMKSHVDPSSMNSEKSHSMNMKEHDTKASTIEWEDKMPKMNMMANEENTQWIFRDTKTGKEGFDINYNVNEGDIKKIRLFNNPDSAHPMQHPIHLHGQRFLVISEDGVLNDNLAWKDTVLVPMGKTVDILVEYTNPGHWALHCHILEHAEAGMITKITVD